MTKQKTPFEAFKLVSAFLSQAKVNSEVEAFKRFEPRLKNMVGKNNEHLLNEIVGVYFHCESYVPDGESLKDYLDNLR